ncbi:hypothetical protein QTP70_003246 [Hemibagrus guttatus]|uniref:FYVE-type zinc finger domain-containing protein n=1 Tax=Hemibagrus guttatus TaxID=175788 RepID=A0AAE0UPK7_9TELE|nr:hypothetical protein QTP70_003246 [Hemibagrus guttatus]KAK3540781.1 hypothetical protein QTP86_001593 [Hemibagrus guttatus]
MAVSTMEEENMVHSDSMSPTSLGIWLKLFQRWELKTPLTEGSARCSQQTRTIRLGLPSLSGILLHKQTQLTTRSDLKHELEEEDTRCLLLAKQRGFNEQCCIRCCGPFSFFLKPRRVCLDCRYNVCKACCSYSQHENGYVCAFCHKSRCSPTAGAPKGEGQAYRGVHDGTPLSERDPKYWPHRPTTVPQSRSPPNPPDIGVYPPGIKEQAYLERNVKGAANAISGWEMQAEGDRVDLLDDLKGADEFGPEFYTGQLEFEIAGGDLDLLSHLICWVWATKLVSLHALSSHCPLEAYMGPFPDFLAFTGPLINSRDL